MTRRELTDAERIASIREVIEAARGDWHEATALLSVGADINWLLAQAEAALATPHPTPSSETPEGERVDALARAVLSYRGPLDVNLPIHESAVDILRYTAEALAAHQFAALSADGWRVEPVALREALTTLADLWERDATRRFANKARENDAANLLAAGIQRGHAHHLRAALRRGPDATD